MHKVYSLQALKNITDKQYEVMGVAIGQVALIKSSLEKISDENDESRAKRIQSLVEKIRQGNRNATKSQPSRGTPRSTTSTSASLKSSAKKSTKTKKMYVGWLHRSSVNAKYRQVKQLKDGGAVREIVYNEDDAITPECIKAQAIKYFFPEGKSKYGLLEQMEVELGNYSQEQLLEFRDTDGKICCFGDYLRSRGLYSSKFTLYLMSTYKADGMEVNDDVSIGGSTNEVLNEDVLMGGTTNTSQEAGKDIPQPNNRSTPLALKIGTESIPLNSQNIHDNILSIGYERHTFSSYSEEVVCRSMSYCRKDCYDMVSFSDFEVLGMELSDFDPIDYGYKVCEISKGEKNFLSTEYHESVCNEPHSERSVVQFPLSKCETNSLIIHPPSEVWGFDGNQLILGVAASCHQSPDGWFVWYRNDTIIKEGNHNCCLPVSSPGSYKVEVRRGGNTEISEAVHVYPVDVGDSSSSTSSAVSATNALDCVPQLPVVDKADIEFSPNDTIGSGSFGTVYKGRWAGTDVAIKQIKVRNAARLRSVVNQEAKVHSLARHPNIVQLMAISYTKNSIFLVSELVNGRNLEDLIFNDDETFFSSCDKCNVAKQISQAIAYLHNLRPPIVHRDIKPANILICEHSHVTKICDMGLSKLKPSHSVSMTTGTMTGTPAYMAPECLVHNKTATTETDVWSLACTLVEVFTERECWEMPEDASGDAQAFIIAAMEREENPPSLQYLADAPHRALKDVLRKCFTYAKDGRPSAIDIVQVLTSSGERNK